MSNRALNWAFDAPLRGSLKSVLVALANHANDDEKCFPSITRLARSSGLSRRAVITAIVQLETLGYIETDKKHRIATHYRMTMIVQQSGEVGSPNLVKSVHPKNPQKPKSRVNLLHPTGEPTSPQPLLTSERKKERIPPIIPPNAFLEWWAIYPRKVGRGAASKAWDKAVKKSTVGEIMSATAKYVWPEDPEYIPHPTTWLNQERWLDEPPAPKLTVDQKIMRTFGLFPDDDDPVKPKGFLQ